MQPEYKMRHDNFETLLHWELFEKCDSFQRNGKWYETKIGTGFRKCGSKHTCDLNIRTVMKGDRG